MEKGLQYSVDPSEILHFQIDRNIVLLFKTFLVILEDLGLEHDIAMSKLEQSLPIEYKSFVSLADYLTGEKGNQLRSKILGAGNDTRREVENIIKNFTITLK